MDRLTFTPAWLVELPEEKRPTFFLRAGSLLERDQFEAELEGRHRAGMSLTFQVLDAAVTGVEALLGDAAGEIVELLRADYARLEGEPSPLAPKERQKVMLALEVLAQHWPDYQVLLEREARRTAILPTLAFSQWCDGWENVRDDKGELVQYARGPLGELDDNLVRRVPFAQMRSAGLEAYGLQYGRSQAKN